MIAQKSIDTVYAEAKIEEIIGDYVHLKKRGVNLLGLCPFHQEKTPSFTVSPTKNIYKCFGCDRGGNAITFLREHEGMSFPDAVRHIAARQKIPLEETEDSREVKEERQLKESMAIVNDFTVQFYTNQLADTDRGKSVGLAYFKQRGLLQKTIEEFQLGYAPPSRVALTKSAEAAGYKIDLLKESGLTTENGFDFFFDRVMFPIHSLSGKVIGFAGRSLSDNKKSPKYLNSKESELYNKRKVLYGLYQAKHAIRKQDECYLTEGYTDVLTLHQNNIANVVAASGTALTSEQLKLIKRYSQNLTMLYDGDPAGIKAAMRGIDLALEQDINVQLVTFPVGEDPDSFMKKKGVTGFTEYIEKNKTDFILFKTKTAMEEAGDDPVKKAALIKDIIHSIAHVEDPIKRSLYIRQCSVLMEMDENLLVAETNKEINRKIKSRRVEQMRAGDGDYIERNRLIERELQKTKGKTQTQKATVGDGIQEKNIVRLLILFGNHQMGEEFEDMEKKPTVAEYILSNVAEIIDEFNNELYADITKEYARLVLEGTHVDPSYFTNHQTTEFQKVAVEVCTDRYEYSENWEKRWDIRLQTQPMPEENYLQEALQSLLILKLRKITKRAEQNVALITRLSKEGKEEELEKQLLLHKFLNETKESIAERLNTVVL